MCIQDAGWQTAVVVESAPGAGNSGRTSRLRVDAQRNLEHVLRAAREVFGELGYGAPMEDVARRASVGVGTVYRRFPSKEVLVRRIAAEETARLTEHARAALAQEQDPWSALAHFLRHAVGSGAGRLLPPDVLRAGTDLSAGPTAGLVPQQRQDSSRKLWPIGAEGDAHADADADAATAELLDVVGQLVERARAVGSLRPDVTVADVLLVISTAAPSLPDAGQRAAASARVLKILLDGLKAPS